LTPVSDNILFKNKYLLGSDPATSQKAGENPDHRGRVLEKREEDI